jgi:hypothetical protein
VVVRYGKGVVLVTLVAPKDYIVEAAAALRAINLSWELGFHRMVLDGNSFQVV